MTRYILIFLAILVTFTAVEYRSHKESLAQDQIVHEALSKAMALEKDKQWADAQRDATKVQADGYKAQAETLLAHANDLEGKVKGLKAKLAAMTPLPPEVAIDTVPTDNRSLAGAYGALGFAPVINGESLAFTTAQARPMLVLVEDGKNYPQALARIEALNDTITADDQQVADLKGAVSNQTQRGDALDVALAKAKDGETACDGEVAQQKVALDAQGKVIAEEKHLKVLWGVAGAVGGFLLKVLLVAL